MKTRSISNDVLAVLSAGCIDGKLFFLPDRQLDRKLYEAVNKVLDALGGKWNRKEKAHVFATDCTDRIESAIETGEFNLPADMGWFPTPAALAERIIEMVGVDDGMTVLEPSAGEGGIYSLLPTQCKVLAFEIDPRRAEVMAQRMKEADNSDEIRCADFLTSIPYPAFDRVIMNPPFAKRADIHHVLHARKFLKPGGKLVAIMSAGIAFREDKLSIDFRRQCDTIEALPEDSFKESGTGVNTVVITMSA